MGDNVLDRVTSLSGNTRDVLKRYGLAAALVAFALSARATLPFPEGTAVYQLPLAAVVLAAWYGGRGPGWFASVVCTTGVLYWFVPPVHSFALDRNHALGFFFFIGLCLLLTEFGASRRRAERALRASEERFRTLVQFSFDVYWESDAQHRFTRQEFSERLSDAPAPESEIGKTRWEIPHVEPDEEGWRKHRETMDGHLPFRDFELARPTPEGGRRYVSVSGMPVFDEAGRFVGYRGVGRHITERKRAEAEHRAHVWFLESMDRINRAMQGTNEVERMMGEVLDVVLEIFGSDRAWLLYPCDPEAPSWRAVMERNRPQFPGAAVHGRDLPMTADAAEVARAALGSRGALLAGAGHGRAVKPEIASRFAVQSEMLMALAPKGDRAYLFGLHQCAGPRSWTKDEQRLFEEIGYRLTDALSSLIAVRSLRESERRLEAAQRVARVGWWERDYETARVVLSDEACHIFGVQPVDLPQWHGRWVSLIHPEDRAKTAAASDAALARGPRYDVEYRVVRPDGTVRMVHSQGDVIWDESGRPLRQFGVMQDVTELRQAEQDLRARQDMLDLAQKAAHAIAFDWYIGARESENRWSPELEAMYGLEPGTFDRTYLGWKKLVHPDDWPSVVAAIKRAHESGDVAAEYRVVHRDGNVRWLQAKGRMFFDAEGRPERMVGFMIDVTDRRRAEEELRAAEAALRESEQRYRTLFEKATDAIFLENERDQVVEANERACALLGYSRDELLQMTVPDLQAPEVRGQAGGVIRAEMQKYGSATFESVDLHRSGRRIPVEVTNTRIIDRGEHLVLSVVRDITERKRAEVELRASEARFRTFVDHATDALFLHDEVLTVVDANRQAYASLGYTREELIGMHPRAFDVGLDESSIVALAGRAASGETVSFETLHRRKDGSVFPVEIRVREFQQGEARFHLSLARDISERKRTEERLREKDNALQNARAELARVSRLTTLGELTASIAHEVNQPLGAMVTNAAACARWMAAKPPDLKEARDALANIVADGKRAGEVIARVRALTKRQMPRLESLDLNRKIAEVITFADHELKSHDIVLGTELAPALPRVNGDRVQLQQVLLNLIVNAIEAMSGVRDRVRELTIVSAYDANGVTVEVRDSGPGLEPERADRVFEPFYTTKPQGIGIGLSISRSIIEAHGGRLWANPNEPHGAVFRFTLPLAPVREP